MCHADDVRIRFILSSHLSLCSDARKRKDLNKAGKVTMKNITELNRFNPERASSCERCEANKFKGNTNTHTHRTQHRFSFFSLQISSSMFQGYIHNRTWCNITKKTSRTATNRKPKRKTPTKTNYSTFI